MANGTPVRTDSQGFHLSGSMEYLLDVIQQLSLARNLAAVQSLVRNAARRLTGCDGATFVLRDGRQCHYLDESAISPLWKGQRYPLEQCISGWCILHREPVVIADIYADERVPHDAYRPTFVKSLVMVPIRARDPIGAIGNYWACPHHASDDEVQILQALADSVSVALENIQICQELEQRVRQRTQELQQALQRIQRLSITDELTGLCNRRGFRMLAEKGMQRAVRHREPVSLAYLDLDGLKRINDQFGHRAGDELIANFAALLKTVYRESDIIARMGGDEFCVLAFGGDRQQQDLRSRLLLAIAAFNTSGDHPHTLSCSVGVVHCTAAAGTTVESLLLRADQGMYVDKHTRSDSRDEALQSSG